MITFTVTATPDVWRVIAERSRQALDLGTVPDGGHQEAAISRVVDLATFLAATPKRLMPPRSLLSAQLDGEEIAVITREIGDWAEELPADSVGFLSGPMGATSTDALAADWAAARATYDARAAYPKAAIVEGMPCPRCDRLFPLDEIDAHRLNCDDVPEAGVYSPGVD